MVSILQEAMNGCSSLVTEISPGLLLKDAAYGAAAYVYYELSNYLTFKDWYKLFLFCITLLIICLTVILSPIYSFLGLMVLYPSRSPMIIQTCVSSVGKLH